VGKETRLPEARSPWIGRRGRERRHGRVGEGDAGGRGQRHDVVVVAQGSSNGGGGRPPNDVGAAWWWTLPPIESMTMQLRTSLPRLWRRGSLRRVGDGGARHDAEIGVAAAGATRSRPWRI
jgi:hypothetical protein